MIQLIEIMPVNIKINSVVKCTSPYCYDKNRASTTLYPFSPTLKEKVDGDLFIETHFVVPILGTYARTDIIRRKTPVLKMNFIAGFIYNE